MSEADDRLRKLVAQSRDVDDCCDEDVDERLSQLRELRDSSAEGLDEDVEVLSALANGTRYSVVRLLVEADEELCVCEITPLFDVSESAVSHALADLSEAGLVERSSRGKWRYYEATERARTVVEALDSTRRGDLDDG